MFSLPATGRLAPDKQPSPALIRYQKLISIEPAHSTGTQGAVRSDRYFFHEVKKVNTHLGCPTPEVVQGRPACFRPQLTAVLHNPVRQAAQGLQQVAQPVRARTQQEGSW